jgi:hypothetical protein
LHVNSPNFLESSYAWNNHSSHSSIGQIRNFPGRVMMVR